MNWRQPAEDGYGYLEKITQPTLVVNGSDDIVIATIDSTVGRGFSVRYAGGMLAQASRWSCPSAPSRACARGSGVPSARPLRACSLYWSWSGEG